MFDLPLSESLYTEYRGFYTRDYFIRNLLNEPMASLINLIWNDHKCKILFIILPLDAILWPSKFLYFNKNLHCCNGRGHVMVLLVPAESVI